MVDNADDRIERLRASENPSEGSSNCPKSPSIQRALNFSGERIQMEIQACVELEEAERKAGELRKRLRLIREGKVPEDRGNNPNYTRVLAENKALRSQMEDLMKGVHSLGKCPAEGVYSPKDLNKLAKEVGCSMRGTQRAPFVATYPFTKEVMKMEVPTKFCIPTVTPYSGTTDPSSFVVTYRQHMVIHGWANALLYRAFPSLLTGVTQEWFEDLPKNTVSSFEELAKKFFQYFSEQRCIKENLEKLTHIRQTTGEAFGALLKRFHDRYFRCQWPSDPVAIQIFKQNMLYKELWIHVERFPPHDMAELWEVATQYADREEYFQMYRDIAREAQHQDAFKGDHKRRFKQEKP